VQNPIKG
jgi:hypothetical protein